MSGDERFVTLAGIGISLLAWMGLYLRSLRFSPHGLPRAPLNALLFALPACLGLVMLILRTMASHDVQNDGRYIAMYGFMGGAWIAIAPGVFLPGLSLRDDFFERRNTAAVLAVLGHMLGSTFCFSGGNIGDGPGWWVVVFCAALANATLAVLWVLANMLAPMAERISVDRDPAIGLRAAGFFVGTGLILGRAVAGDWISAEATVRDFALRAWPALMLLVLLVLSERGARPRFRRSEIALFSRGVIPAVAYAGLGLAVVLAQGRIE
jgi:uncharacterized membrane protein YjfL (UPF0719 family)